MGFRRLHGRLDQVQGHANVTMDDVQALVADCRDGVGVKVRPLPGFSAFVNRLVVALVVYLIAILLVKLREYIPFLKQPPEPPQLDLTWLEGEDIPLLISIDPTVDVKE